MQSSMISPDRLFRQIVGRITDTSFAQRFRPSKRAIPCVTVGGNESMTTGLSIRSGRLHAFVACLCAVAMIVSLLAGAVRSAAATSLSDSSKWELSGTATIQRKAACPIWTPPVSKIARDYSRPFRAESSHLSMMVTQTPCRHLRTTK